MHKRTIKVSWPTGQVSYYESVVACAAALGVTKATVNNYLHGYAPLGIKFEYSTMTGEEQLLREVMNVNKVIRLDE